MVRGSIPPGVSISRCHMSSVITIIKPDQRDNYGQYRILPGHIQVFEFSIPLLGSLEIKIAHILPNSQDFSIDFWISEKPLDGLVLGQGFGHHKAHRRADKFVIYDSYLRANDEDDRLFLQSTRTYYLNAKNLQNKYNAFELDFSITADPITP